MAHGCQFSESVILIQQSGLCIRETYEVKFGFAYRIALMLAITLVAGTALTSVLSLHKFERILADLLTSRFEFVANNLRSSVETQMDLGLSLEHLENINEEMEALNLNDEQILSIEIFDGNGTVIFSTDPSFIGDLVAEDWIFSWQVNRGKSSWSMLERDAGVVGVGLQNNLNQDVGSIALRYSRNFLDQSVTEQLERLLLLVGMVALVMTVLSILGCTTLLKSYFRDWHNMRQALADISMQNRASERLHEANLRHPEFENFSTSTFNAYDSLDSATDELRKLDEEAV